MDNHMHLLLKVPVRRSVPDDALHEAVKAAGWNQLRSLGIRDRGEIAPGQVADLVLVDGELRPRKTLVGR